jgi:hypothetical protein
MVLEVIEIFEVGKWLKPFLLYLRALDDGLEAG